MVEYHFLNGANVLIARKCDDEASCRIQATVDWSKQRAEDGRMNRNQENDSVCVCACSHICHKLEFEFNKH